MRPTQPQTCPLCSNAAEYYPVEHGRRKHFLCSRCTQFQISGDAETWVRHPHADVTAKLSTMAKPHPKGATLVISLPSGLAAQADAQVRPVSEYVENSRSPA